MNPSTEMIKGSSSITCNINPQYLVYRYYVKLFEAEQCMYALETSSIIALDNGLAPIRRHAIIGTNVGI